MKCRAGRDVCGHSNHLLNVLCRCSRVFVQAAESLRKRITGRALELGLNVWYCMWREVGRAGDGRDRV